jgi:hypothetical protein
LISWNSATGELPDALLRGTVPTRISLLELLRGLLAQLLQRVAAAHRTARQVHEILHLAAVPADELQIVVFSALFIVAPMKGARGAAVDRPHQLLDREPLVQSRAHLGHAIVGEPRTLFPEYPPPVAEHRLGLARERIGLGLHRAQLQILLERAQLFL